MERARWTMLFGLRPPDRRGRLDLRGRAGESVGRGLRQGGAEPPPRSRRRLVPVPPRKGSRMTDAVLSDRQKMGWGLAALVVAGNMIGSGLYMLPVSLAPTGGSSLIGWLVAAAGAATLALVFGALGRLQPDADGLAGL